eukprot:29843-Pelagococcus_subviridis.AAC.1
MSSSIEPAARVGGDAVAGGGGGGGGGADEGADDPMRAPAPAPNHARSMHWSPYDPVREVDADP